MINPLVPRILWSGSGSTDELTLTADGQPLTFSSPSEIVVKQFVTAEGEVTSLTHGVHFNLSGYPVTAAGPPATLTRIAGDLPVGYTWAVTRSTPVSQTLDITLGGDFSSAEIEAALDKTVVLAQEAKEVASRAFSLSVFDAGSVSPDFPKAQALNYIRWDADGAALENAAQVDLTGTVVSSFVETLLDDSNAAAARGTLGLGSISTKNVTAFVETILDDTDAATVRATIGLQPLAILSSAAVPVGHSPQADGAGAVSFANVTPIGSILLWATATPPTGWLECSGQAVSRTTYAALFALIGVTYGAGDASTTFNLPDMRGRFVRGWSHGTGRDPDAVSRTNRGDDTTGDNVGTIQTDEFESHTHPLSFNMTSATAVDTGGTTFIAFGSADGPTGATGGNETRPLNINMMYVIRAQ